MSRTLLRTSAMAAPALVELLGQRGIPAFWARGSWRALPRGLRFLLVANLAAGAALGALLDPSFALSTAVVVPALGWGATLRLRRPLLEPGARRSSLPDDLEQQLTGVLGELPPGAARSLLVDVVRSAQAAFSLGLPAGDALAQRVRALVSSSSSAARELADLDDALERLDKQRAPHAELPQGWLAGLARCESARDALVQRLLESLAALGLARSDGVAERAADELAELTAELESERQIQAEAARELEAFLDA